MNFLLPAELANKIHAYLTKRPYEEVADFIKQLTTLQSVNVVPPQDKTPEPPPAPPNA